MNKRIWVVLAVLTCGLSPAAPSAAPGVEPDPPSGSAREAELAKKAAAIVDAFSDSDPVLTRDGRKVVFSSNRDGLPQLYVADVARPEAPPARIVKTSERVNAAWPLPDGKTVIFTSDHGADENWSVFTCSLDGSGLVERTPRVRLQRGSPFVPDGAPETAFYSGRNLSSPSSSVYSLSLARGSTEQKIYEDRLPGALADVTRDGKWGLWIRFPSSSDNTLVLVDLAKGTGRVIYPPEGAPKSVVGNASFSHDGRRIFVATDAGGEQALLLALDAGGKEVARYAETRFPGAEVDSLVVSKTTGRVALSLGAGNHTEIRILDAATLKPAAEVALPLGSGGAGFFSEDGKVLTASWSTPDSPGSIYAIDVQTGKASPLRKEPRPSLEGLPRVQASIVEVAAFDGLKLPTNVYLPEGGTGQKRPVLVVYHGGPAGSSQIRWSPTVRFFTSLGYAVVEPNVRGSGGFGRSFEMADNGPRRLDAFKDIETTARWAASQPWADKDHMVVYGGSYGGYTVLIALERWPDLWKAGVDLFGVANMTTFLQSTSGVIREIFKVEFGDLDKDGPFLKTISPIEEVDKIKAPLFVYAGANDPRVPRPESDQIVQALRTRKVPVEYMVAENEGHSLSRKENQITFYSRTARFLETELR
ncbi:MAG: prolyl oligopeptidase family serine peptidase [Thermoanaerobaculia bacterium]